MSVEKSVFERLAAVNVGPHTENVFSLSVPFSKGTINVQVSVTGGAIRPAHLARVRKYLQLAEDEWEEKNDANDYKASASAKSVAASALTQATDKK